MSTYAIVIAVDNQPGEQPRECRARVAVAWAGRGHVDRRDVVLLSTEWGQHVHAAVTVPDDGITMTISRA